jgi:hypothetical protein
VVGQNYHLTAVKECQNLCWITFLKRNWDAYRPLFILGALLREQGRMEETVKEERAMGDARYDKAATKARKEINNSRSSRSDDHKRHGEKSSKHKSMY